MTQLYQQLIGFVLAAAVVWGAEWPILSLKVDGLRNYREAQVLAVAGLKVGEVVSRERFEKARDHLLASGVFEEVSYKYTATPDGKGYAAVFQVVEVQPVYPVRFEELPVKDEELLALLGKSDPLFGPKIAAVLPIVKRYAALIQERVKEDVVGRVAPDDSGQLSVLFRPAKQLPSVAEVDFRGNKIFPVTTLQTAIVAAVGLVYQEKRFRFQLDLAIRPLYEARGYVRVSFPKIDIAPAKDVNGVAATVVVDEGAVYKLASVEIAGAPLDLYKAAGFKPDEVFDINAVETGRLQAERALRKSGYLRAKSSFDRRYDDAKKTVALTLKVEPGPRYTFGKLDVRGLDIHSEPAIRKMWTLKPGQPFNADYPDYFLLRLREDGVLDNLGETRADAKVDDKAHAVDVTLYFRGAPPPPDERRKRPMGAPDAPERYTLVR